MNKTTSQVKLDHLSSSIKHAMVWIGAITCGLDDLWPNQHCCNGGVDINGGTTQF